jgi:hypothetical protein
LCRSKASNVTLILQLTINIQQVEARHVAFASCYLSHKVIQIIHRGIERPLCVTELSSRGASYQKLSKPIIIMQIRFASRGSTSLAQNQDCMFLPVVDKARMDLSIRLQQRREHMAMTGLQMHETVMKALATAPCCCTLQMDLGLRFTIHLRLLSSRVPS